MKGLLKLLKKPQEKKLISATNRIFIVIFAFSFISWASQPKSQDIKIVNQIQSKVEKKLTADGTVFVEARVTAMFNEVKELGFRLRSTKKLNLEETRVLYVNCVAALLKEVNENEKIRPYLIKYPFTYENTDILIAFRERDSVPPPYIALVLKANEFISYSTYNNKINFFDTLHRETFEEALKIVEETTGKKIDLGY